MFTDAVALNPHVTKEGDFCVTLNAFPFKDKWFDLSQVTKEEVMLCAAILLRDDEQIKKLLGDTGYSN